MRRMITNKQIDELNDLAELPLENTVKYVGKLQKGTEVYVYPPVIGEDGFYISYDPKLTVEYWEEEEVGEEEVNFESHKLDGYVKYSSPLLEENNIGLDLDMYLNVTFPENINTYQDLANWIEANLSELEISLEGGPNFFAINGASIYRGEYELNKNQFFYPHGITEINDGETFVSIPEILLQNITGYENQPIDIKSNVYISGSQLRVDRIESNSASGSNDVNIKRVNTQYLRVDEIYTRGFSITITTPNPNANTILYIKKLPTSDPHVVDAIWNDNGTLKISLG